jgi:NADH dehydrogenase
MTQGVVTVFGGSGFLGRRVVDRLAVGGARVRVAVRHPERARPPDRAGSDIAAVRADVRDESSVAEAVAGATSVVNCVSAYVESGRVTYAAIHQQGAETVAREAGRAGAARLVHISGIGADAGSASKYIRSRGRGEEMVREAFAGATILRPSVMFGPDDAFLNSLAGLLRVSPVFPLIGGETRLQPVYVGDVAEAVGKVIDAPDAPGQIYELGGPRVVTLRELVRLVLAEMGRSRVLVPVPWLIAEGVASVAELLPSPPVTRGQVELLQRDNVVRETARTLRDLGIAPTSIETILPACARRAGASAA